MLNERDERHEGQDDSEYHFSDEDISYEMEPEGSKTAAIAPPSEAKGNFLSHLTPYRRMLIGGAAFLALVFFIYKVLLPSSSTPSTEFASTTQGSEQSPPAAPVTTTAAMSVSQPQQPAISSVPSSPPAMPQQIASATPQPAFQQQVPMSTAQPAMATAAPSTTATPSSYPSAASSMNQDMTQLASSSSMSMPAVIPVRSDVPTYNTSSSDMLANIQTQQSSAEAKINALEEENRKLIGQLHDDYLQKVNDFMEQSKNTQQSVQTLNTRVANMESQLSQLVESLNQQNRNKGSEATSGLGPQSSAEPKISFTVQAIIPGRAWLKSDNGETVTVAEGDTLKDYGRIMKIDPYDGVVEIDTGNKLVSLSYGNAS